MYESQHLRHQTSLTAGELKRHLHDTPGEIIQVDMLVGHGRDPPQPRIRVVGVEGRVAVAQLVGGYALGQGGHEMAAGGRMLVP